jgi:hypothetical protein
MTGPNGGRRKTIYVLPDADVNRMEPTMSTARTFSTSLSYNFMPKRPFGCGLYVAIYFMSRASSSAVNGTLCLAIIVRMKRKPNKREDTCDILNQGGDGGTRGQNMSRLSVTLVDPNLSCIPIRRIGKGDEMRIHVHISLEHSLYGT